MGLGGFSWKRLLGISAAKSRVSRAIGVPLTKSGRQRKIGSLLTGGGRKSKSSGGGCGLVLLLVVFFGWRSCGGDSNNGTSATDPKITSNGYEEVTDTAPMRPTTSKGTSGNSGATGQVTPPKEEAGEVIEPKDEPLETPDIEEKSEYPSLYLKSLENVPLPAILIVSQPVGILDATGKEVMIPLDTVIKVSKRSGSGTLTMEINGDLFVGNENRLSGKVRLR